MKYIFSIALLALILSCTPNRPSYVLSEGDMEDILVDYHLALAMAELQTGDLQENRYILTQAALRKHGVTEAELDTSLLYWCRNSEKFVRVCERVSERLTFMAESQGVERQEKNTYSYLATEGDTANVWNLREGVVLIPNVVDNIYSFRIDADSTYLPGDYFMWAFNVQFMSSDRYTEAYALLSVEYENDSIVGTSQRLSGRKNVEIKLQCPKKCADLRILSINGTIYIPVRDSGFGILAIKNFVLVRYHDLMRTINVNPADTIVQYVDTVAHTDSIHSDTLRVRQNPYDIRGNKSDKRTINIVKDKPLKAVKRRR